MSRYILFEHFAEDAGTVIGWYTNGTPEDVSGGIETEAPDPPLEQYPNLEAVLRIKLDTGELYYDYISNETTELRLEHARSDLEVLRQEKSIISSEVSTLNIEMTDTQVGLTEAYETALTVEEDNTKTQVALTEVYEELLRTQAALSTINLAIQTLQLEIEQLKGE